MHNLHALSKRMLTGPADPQRPRSLNLFLRSEAVPCYQWWKDMRTWSRRLVMRKKRATRNWKKMPVRTMMKTTGTKEKKEEGTTTKRNQKKM